MSASCWFDTLQVGEIDPNSAPTLELMFRRTDVGQFDAFERRWEQLGDAIVVVLLGTCVLDFVFFLMDLV